MERRRWVEVRRESRKKTLGSEKIEEVKRDEMVKRDDLYRREK